VVTGASSGIGRCLAQRLAGRGYDLVLVARREARLQHLKAEVGAGRDVRCVVADLSEPAPAAEAIAAAVASGPPVEVLMNNAGCGCYAPFLELPAAEGRRLLRLNFEAPAAVTRQLLPGMLQRHRGHVINICSMSVKMGPWGHSLYAASKSALVALTQCLACEYEGEGVRFSYVNPGIVATEFFDDPGFAELRPRVRRYAVTADHVARHVVRLLDRPKLELCVPRHYRVVDWIQAISPRLLQRIVRRSSAPAADRPASSTTGGVGESRPVAGRGPA